MDYLKVLTDVLASAREKDYSGDQALLDIAQKQMNYIVKRKTSYHAWYYTHPRDEWMLEPRWQEFTKENYAYLATEFPEIFKKDAVLPEKGYDRWKVNQLVVWLQMNWKSHPLL